MRQTRHGTLAGGDRGRPVQEQFPSGVKNGNSWYPVYNGLQDWLYIATGCRAITLELSEDKWPPAHLLPVRNSPPPPVWGCACAAPACHGCLSHAAQSHMSPVWHECADSMCDVCHGS